MFLPYEKFQLCCLSSRQESSFTELFIYFAFVPVLCLCSTDCLCLLFIKSHSELTFAPGSSVSSDKQCSFSLGAINDAEVLDAVESTFVIIFLIYLISEEIHKVIIIKL